MKKLLAVLIFLVAAVSIAYGGWFPITAWGIKYDDVSCTTWVEEVKEDWNGNSIMIGRGRRDPNTISLSEMARGREESLFAMTLEYVIASDHIHFVQCKLWERGNLIVRKVKIASVVIMGVFSQ